MMSSTTTCNTAALAMGARSRSDASRASRRFMCATPRTLSRYSLSRQVIRLRLVVEELGDVVAEDELEIADGAVALLGDDDLGDALLLRLLVVHLVAIDERDEIGVLLDGTRFAEVGELRAVIAGALFGATRELRERKQRHVQFLGDGLEAARDLRDLLLARFDLAFDGHQLEVIDHDHVQARLHLQTPRFRAHL